MRNSLRGAQRSPPKDAASFCKEFFTNRPSPPDPVKPRPYPRKTLGISADRGPSRREDQFCRFRWRCIEVVTGGCVDRRLGRTSQDFKPLLLFG